MWTPHKDIMTKGMRQPVNVVVKLSPNFHRVVPTGRGYILRDEPKRDSTGKPLKESGKEILLIEDPSAGACGRVLWEEIRK